MTDETRLLALAILAFLFVLLTVDYLIFCARIRRARAALKQD